MKKVVKVKGERAAEQAIAKWEKKGYKLENMNSRKQMYSVWTGVFTGKQIHTLIFTKP